MDAQAGYSYQDFKTDGNSISYRNNVDTGIREQFISDVNNPNNREYRPRNLQAFFARGNVDLLGKYLLGICSKNSELSIQNSFRSSTKRLMA